MTIDLDELARRYAPTHPRLQPEVTQPSQVAAELPADAPGDPVVENTGVMIALYPDEQAAGALEIDPAQVFTEDLEDVTAEGPEVEDADDLHLILLYLGKLGAEFDAASAGALLDAVAQWAFQQQTLHAETSGIGVFSTPDGPATYVSVDSVDLPAFRQSLLEAVQAAGIQPVLNHGFTPHITVAWGDMRQIPLPQLNLEFAAVSVVVGDTRVDIPLGQGQAEPADDVSTDAVSARAQVTERTPELARTGTDSKTNDWSFATTVNGRTVVTTAASTWNAPLSSNRHMLWIQGRFVGGETPNRNGAFWSSGDLEMGLPTVSHGPLNWLHEERHIIGAIADSKFLPGQRNTYAHETAGETTDPHIVVAANVWKWIYPEEAAVVEMASMAGQLATSMECVSEKVGCAGPAGCGQEYAYIDYIQKKTCAHLGERGNVHRLVNPTFLGGAVIVPPSRPGWADADMRVIAAQQASDAYDQAGRPDIKANTWDHIVSGAVKYAAALA